MANQVQLGELVVVLRGDSAKLEAAAKRVADALRDTEKNAKNSGKGVESAVTGMITRFVSLAAVVQAVRLAVQTFNQTISDISALDRLSQATGISIQSLSSLQQAMRLSGVEVQEFNQTILQFNGRLREMSTNASGPTAQAFRTLGISIRDASGNLRTVEDMLPELADAFSRYADGANKAAIAGALFGEQGGPVMTRFLNQGSEAIKRQRGEIENSGRVVTREGVEKAKQYKEAMVELQMATEQLARDFTLMLAPSITQVAKSISDFLNQLRVGSSTSIWELNDRLGELRLREEKLRKDLADPGFWGAFANAAGAKSELESVQREIADIEERAARFRRDQKKNLFGGPEENQPTGPQAPPLPDMTAINDQLALTMERLNGMPALMQTAFGDNSWLPAFKAAMAEQEALMIKQGATASRIATMKLQMQKREQDELLNTASIAAQTITALFAKSKNAAIAAALINTGVAVTKMLSSGHPPLNFINAALVAAQGAAQVAAIRSTSESGSGSVATGGGATAAPEAPPEPSRALHIQGLDPAHMFSGSVVQGLIEAINGEVRDGVRLISTENVRT